MPAPTSQTLAAPPAAGEFSPIHTSATRRLLSGLLVAGLVQLGLLITGSLRADDAVQAGWPQFLGPHRTGISETARLRKDWPADGLPVRWRAPGGVGMSGLAVSDGLVVTLLQHDGQQRVAAWKAASGEPAWSTAVAAEYKNGMGDGPRATPTIAGGQVYAYTGEGKLVALQLADGKLLWSQDAVGQQGGKVADYGMASSPLVVGKLVVVTVGAPRATVAAYDRSSGKLQWTAGQDTPAGYSSPVVRKLGGQEQIVVFAGDRALGLALPGGKQLWSYPYVTDYHCNIAAPVAFDGKLLLSSGENHGAVLLDFKKDAEQLKPSPIWESQGSSSTLRNEWQTSVLLGGHLYGFDNVGSAGPVTHLTCVEAATGKRLWQQRRFGKGNLIAADGRLWIITMDGELVAVTARPDRFEELGRMQLLGATRQAPALAAGLLYARDDREIVCVDLRQP